MHELERMKCPGCDRALRVLSIPKLGNQLCGTCRTLLDGSGKYTSKGERVPLGGVKRVNSNGG